MRKFTRYLFSALCVSILVTTTYASQPVGAWERGRGLFEQGRWSEARVELLDARQALTDDPAALAAVDYYLAVCAVKLGAQDAEAVLQGYTKRYPESVHNNAIRYELALHYCTVGDYAAARQTFDGVRYRSLDPLQKEHYDLRMGYICFVEGDYAGAEKYFDRIPAKSEFIDHALYYRAYMAYARGDYNAAREGFNALMTSESYGDVAPYYLLQIEFKCGDYLYVTRRGDELIARVAEPQRTELLRVMAESWFRLGEYSRPLSYLDAYRASGGEMGREENYLYGFSLYRTARYEAAQEYLRRACGADDALTQNASYHLADCYLRSGDKQRAMQSFAMASSSGFDAEVAEDALFNYGKLQYELGGGLFNETINVLTRYIDTYPISPRLREAQELLIAAYYNSRDYDAAYLAISTYPDPDSEILAAKQKIAYFRALEQWEQGDAAAAVETLAESARIGISPKYTSLASFWQGEIAYEAGDYAGALQHFDTYIKRAPRHEREYALAHYDRAYCYFSREEMASARTAFDRFLELHKRQDSYFVDACSRVGDTYYADRRFDEALKSYDRAIAAGTTGGEYARYKRAVTLGILGRTQEKIDALKQLESRGAGDYLDDALYELGRTYIAREEYRPGAEVLERLLTSCPDSPHESAALSELGLAYLNLGDRAKSLTYYDRVVRSAPRSAEAKDALQGIRDIYVSEGNADGYFDYAEKTGVETDLTSVARDSLSFAAARKIYATRDYELAAKSLRSYLKSYPKGYYRPDALYCLSDCYMKTNDHDAAIGSLTELADCGSAQYVRGSLRLLARLTSEAKRYDEAASAYRRLADVETKAEGKSRAMLGYAEAVIAAGDADQIVAMADDVASFSAAGDEAWRKSQFAKARVLHRRGELDAALAIYRTLSANVDHVEGAESAYYLIEETFRAGNDEQAAERVFALAERETPHAYWLAKAYLLLGDMYVRQGDDFQARATYQSIADGYTPVDDGIVAAANERIEKLKE